MPFELCNATATFQRLMNRVLEGVPQSYGNVVLCYVDDILIATTTIEQLIEKLNRVFQRLHQAGLKCKCSFMQWKVTFLGRVIGEGTITPDVEMYNTLSEWQVPRNKKELQSFLGFIKYYRDFIPNLSEINFPLKELTKPNRTYGWKEQHDASFKEVKQALLGSPFIHQPTEEGKNILDTDASDVALAGILYQVQEHDSVSKECPSPLGVKLSAKPR